MILEPFIQIVFVFCGFLTGFVWERENSRERETCCNLIIHRSSRFSRREKWQEIILSFVLQSQRLLCFRMDGSKVVAFLDDELNDDLHSVSGTPLIAHSDSFYSRTNHVSSGVQQKIEDASKMKWHNSVLQKQLIEATLQDKKLSEICLQRALQRPQIRISDRTRSGSWGSLKYLLFGIVPVSLFIFVLACAISHIKLEYPQ